MGLVDLGGLAALLPGPAQAAGFAAAVAVLNATPGADLLLTVSRTVQAGARAGLAAAAGIATGCAVHALAAAFGLAALLALHPAWFTALQWAGAGWLAWLGWGQLRQAWGRGASAIAASPAALAAAVVLAATLRRSLRAEFRAGLLTNVLNPKVALFFLVFLPPFVPVPSPSPTVSLLLLGTWFAAQGLLFLVAVVAVTARAAPAVPPAWRRALGAAGGLLFFGLALRLVWPRPAVL